MRTVRVAVLCAVGALFAGCESPPTAMDADGPQLMRASEDNMLVPWFYSEGPQWVPCANGGEGAEFAWGAEIAGFGAEHLTPSGNYQQVLTVKFRNVEFRDPDGNLYPFRQVEQVNVTHVQHDGQMGYLIVDNEFYTTPDGRNVRWYGQYHLNVGADGQPALERFTISCSPSKW